MIEITRYPCPGIPLPALLFFFLTLLIYRLRNTSGRGATSFFHGRRDRLPFFRSEKTTRSAFRVFMSRSGKEKTSSCRDTDFPTDMQTRADATGAETCMENAALSSSGEAKRNFARPIRTPAPSFFHSSPLRPIGKVTENVTKTIWPTARTRFRE